MRHFVAYHNNAQMGPDDDPLSVVTSKPMSARIEGDRVWLIDGVGLGPKQYRLVSSFIATNVVQIAGDRFDHRIEGEGRTFDPPRLLNDHDWFADFLKSQQNFSLGLREITDSPHLERLLEILAIEE